MRTNTNNKVEAGTPQVPVLDADMRPLMACHPARARQMLNHGKASTYRNKLGVFCIILHKDAEPNNHPLALGVDPGSRFDSWSVLGTKCTVLNGMSEAPTWKGLLYWTPIPVHRRQLHALQPSKGGLSRPYGGTRRMGLTRGTLVRCIKHGLTYVDGTLKNRVSLHCFSDGNRLTQNANVEGLDVLTIIHWRARLLPTLSGGVPAAHD